MARMIKAIETQYKGYRFRSRLEARWAVFFDALDVEWEYELQGYDLGEDGKYLPDFWLPGHNVFIEVKPTLESDHKKARFLAMDLDAIVVILTRIPETNFFLNRGKIYEVFDFSETNDSWGISIPAVFPANGTEIARYLELDFNESGYGPQFICPICEMEWVHFGDPNVQKGNDDYSAWRGRGHAIRVPMYCENGCSWDFRMGFHKGQTYCAIENPMRFTRDPGSVFSGGDNEKLLAALTAARSARFEHGESPQ